MDLQKVRQRAGHGSLEVTSWYAAILDERDTSLVSYDDTAGYELEVTLVSTPHHDPIVIGRSRTGDHCQITLERWLRIDGEPDAENAVNIIHAILAASAHPDSAGIIDTTGKS